MEQQQSNSNPNPNIFERFNHWVSSSVLVRIFSITILVLLLMIPNAMIRDIIHERQRTNDEAIREVSSKWGNSQTVLGPVISVPYLKYKEDKDGKREYYRKWSHFLPEDLRVSGNVSTEYRKRGIYKVVVYDSELKVSGNFKKPDPLQLGIDPSSFLINEAVVSIGIPDMRGISKKVELVLNDTTLEFGPGVPHVDIISEGISTTVNLVKTRITHFQSTSNCKEASNYILYRLPKRRT